MIFWSAYDGFQGGREVIESACIDQDDQRSAAPHGSAGRLPWLLAAFGLLWAVALRLTALLSRWPLHIDELRVTQNLAERGLLGLTRPLDHDQFTPIGVLWVLKGLAELFGYAQGSLQLWPMLAGLGAVAVTGVWAWRSFGPWAGVVAIGLLGSAPKLIEHGLQVKQYSTALLAASAVLLAGWYVLNRPGQRVLIGWGAVCLLGVVFSHAAVFMVAGVGIAIGLALLRSGDRKRLGTFVIATLPSAGVFLLFYLINYSHGSESDLLDRYWKQDFMPAPGSDAFVRWWIQRAIWLLSPVAFPYTVVGAAGFVAGLAWLIVRRRWALGLMLGLPMMFTLLGAVLHAYPFGGRMVVFLAPIVAGLMGAGVGWGITAWPWHRPILGAVVVVGLCSAMSLQAPVRQPMNSGGRYAMDRLDELIGEAGGPVVYDAVLHYHYQQSLRTGSLPNGWVMRRIIQRDRQADVTVLATSLPIEDLLPPGPAPQRLWVVVPERTFLSRDKYGPTREAVLKLYHDHYRLIDQKQSGGVFAFQFERIPTPD